MIKVCVRCGEKFETPRKQGLILYCDNCRKEVIREQKRASKARAKTGECSYKSVKRVCEVCGEEFDGHFLAKYCAKCRPEVKRDKARVAAAERRRRDSAQALSVKPSSKPLDDWAREARECNLDYGNYRTLIEIGGMTFDELQAQNSNRALCCHSHCKTFRKMD